jgi:anti-sigma28 factor (negative regulator of flagellin synthesis)
VSSENTDAAVVSLRTQSAFEEDAKVREQRVQRIKQAVRQGMYPVDTKKVAVSVIRELAN